MGDRGEGAAVGCPQLVSRKWVEQHTRKWGEGSPRFQARIAAEFPCLADDTIVSLAELEAAMRRELEPGLPLVVAADIARFGRDETVIVVRAGNVVRIAKAYSGRDTMNTFGELLRVARDAQRDYEHEPLLVVDDAGLGGGVVDRLRELREFKVEAFLGASASRSKEYPRGRDEAWFGFADRLPDLDLPADEELAADLLAPRYASTAPAGGSSKRRAKRSDVCDARPTVATRSSWRSRLAGASAGPLVVGVVAGARGPIQPVRTRPGPTVSRATPLVYVAPSAQDRARQLIAGCVENEVAAAITAGPVRFDAGDAFHHTATRWQATARRTPGVLRPSPRAWTVTDVVARTTRRARRTEE